MFYCSNFSIITSIYSNEIIIIIIIIIITIILHVTQIA
jgi:hypothetical protein